MRNLEEPFQGKMECISRKRMIKDLNDVFTCKLCHGYLIDATTLVDCLHTFCRGCILRHFDSGKTQIQCPICPVLYKKKSQCFRADIQIQSLVYKSVPYLYLKEMQRREDFYRSTGVRAGSSCSDDSVIDRERDMIHGTEEIISQYIGDKTQFFSQDDLISLSLEYYQAHLDTTVAGDKFNSAQNSDKRHNGQIASDKIQTGCEKRYLQCPAGVSMKHLQKFLRMKYGLTEDHKVDIIHKGEVLPSNFSLMDVAYTFQWEKIKPMRFFYKIFTPLKIRPIKIVNTPTPTGGKQLQIVPVTSNNHVITPPATNQKSPTTHLSREETESELQDKEHLLANLQLQSKTKALAAEAKRVHFQQPPQVPLERLVKDCVFEYEEPDQEEIKRFAEKRDREWAMQKKLEEDLKADRDDFFSGYPSKKRKKSKHSKNDSNGHKEKKPKLHAEITNNDKSDLKLKVKITTNGHKHKHHKIENISELSSKEKLLQMRQVRHKHMSADDKPQPLIPTIKFAKSYISKETDLGVSEAKRKKEASKAPEYSSTNHFTENNNKPLMTEPKPRIDPMVIKPTTDSVGSKTISSGTPRNLPQQSIPTNKFIKKDVNTKTCEQKVFLKNASSNISTKESKIGPGKIENAKTPGQMPSKVLPIGSITTNNKTLDRKIASLQQRCTIEPKTSVTHLNKGKVSAPQYPPGFTVSKIESGVKKKSEDKDHKDNRPSLEITLIPPTSNSKFSSEHKSPTKRPPPGTIPLERIKNAVNLKSGISIIPKIPESRTDNIGVLDLSKPNTKSPEYSPRSSPKIEPINGLPVVNRQMTNVTPRPLTSPENKSMQLSNLQMLSKVASEHPTLNNLTNSVSNKIKPQLPSLQTINKAGTVPNTIRTPGLQRMPPKLNDIQKFKSVRIRSVRPSQNQNIRNIPNPSLVLNRNLNQNRLVSSTNSIPVNNISPLEKKVATPKASPNSVSSSTNNLTVKEVKEIQPIVKTQTVEQKTCETKEVSV
ncbi:hypothetical protein ABEB36_007652 [Hypothenemus hampei]|uniref:RING-type domain-containing protein n=1 Tax=Hypothenemus hampei TaxID=57062 RepID=A0ABD1EV79_HYPHA